jgi:hypothetical protein
MTSKKLMIVFLISNIFNSLFADIKVVCSAALLNNQFEFRKQQYIKCFEILTQYGYPKPFAIEAFLKKGPSFLDDYCKDVFYAQSNNLSLKNKGVNEGRTMLEGLKHFNFAPNDMVVKLTGRYFFSNDSFLRTVENNPDADAIVRQTILWDKENIVTGCFALKNHYLIDFLEHLDFEKMERNMIDIEWEMKLYIQKIIREKNAKVIFVDLLHLSAHVWGLDNNMGTYYW